jgi:hypothetical protein
MGKLIITTLSTYLKHQQSGSRLAKKIDRSILNGKLTEVFLRVSIEEEYRLLLVKSYTQFIFAPGSNFQHIQCRPSGDKPLISFAIILG